MFVYLGVKREGLIITKPSLLCVYLCSLELAVLEYYLVALAFLCAE